MFVLERLPDELREKILSNLTLKELMAFEYVSKRWQSNVSGVLKGIKVVTNWIEGQEKDRHYFNCGTRHHSRGNISSPGSICLKTDDICESVVRLIRRLTNIVAAHLPDGFRSDVLTAALSNCSKLEHLAFTRTHLLRHEPIEMEIPKAFIAKQTCLAVFGAISSEAIKDMTSLTRLSAYRHYSSAQIPVDQLIILFKGGLVGLDTTFRYEDLNTLCKHGHRLDCLNVDCFD